MNLIALSLLAFSLFQTPSLAVPAPVSDSPKVTKPAIIEYPANNTLDTSKLRPTAAIIGQLKSNLINPQIKLMLYKDRQMFKGETLHSIDPNRLVYELKAISPEKTTMGERSICLKDAIFEHLIDAETGKILSFGSRCKIENYVSGLAGFDK